MSPWPVELGGASLGSQSLIDVARQRVTGLLTWNAANGFLGLWFRAGRPEALMETASSVSRDRAAVQKLVRTIAIANQGRLDFESKSYDTEPSLGIDTLGEVLVAVARLAPAEVLRAVWQKHRAEHLSPALAFEKVSAALAAIGLTVPAKPNAHTAVDAILSQAGDAGLGPLTALWVLGGVALDEQGAGENAVAPANNAEAVLAQIDQTFAQLETQSYYELLKIDRTATPEAVRNAYFEAAKAWHSDHFAGTDLGDRMRKVEAIFARVNDALKVLSDPKERQGYNFMLDRQAQGLPTDINVIMEAENFFRHGQAALRRGEGAGAEPLLKQAIALNKGEAEFWVYWGYALYCAKGTHSYGDAKEAIEQGLKMNEKLDTAYEFLGRMARVEREDATAIRHFKKALSLNPKNREAERELRLIERRKTNPGAAAPTGARGFLSKLLGH